MLVSKKYKFLVLNGPNLDMLGLRDKNQYGTQTYKDLRKIITKHCKMRGVRAEFYQTYNEGVLARLIAISNQDEFVNKNLQFLDWTGIDIVFYTHKFDGIVINAGAYSHYSYAIRDAIELTNTPIAEVHISDISKREEFRQNDVLKDVVDVYIKGEGFDGYTHAIDELINICEAK